MCHTSVQARTHRSTSRSGSASLDLVGHRRTTIDVRRSHLPGGYCAVDSICSATLTSPSWPRNCKQKSRSPTHYELIDHIEHVDIPFQRYLPSTYAFLGRQESNRFASGMQELNGTPLSSVGRYVVVSAVHGNTKRIVCC